MNTLARLITLVFLAGIAVPSLAEQPADDIQFAAPVRLKAGDALLGASRLYPSPAMHDVNADGIADVVIGDLFGKVTVAYRSTKSGAATLGAEKPIQMKGGKDLKFHNW